MPELTEDQQIELEKDLARVHFLTEKIKGLRHRTEKIKELNQLTLSHSNPRINRHKEIVDPEFITKIRASIVKELKLKSDAMKAERKELLNKAKQNDTETKTKPKRSRKRAKSTGSDKSVDVGGEP